MSFFRWFGKKKATPDAGPSQNSDLGQVDVTLPNNRSVAMDKSGEAGSRRSERMERRELLYGVVRECMVAAGVLSSAYKFKVLSLDSSGRKYLIMMDMPHQHLADPARFAEIEGAIARSAKDRHEILVTAVYWRINEMVTAHGQHPPLTAHSTVAPHSAPPPRPAPAPAYAPIQEDEVLAFKRALAAGARAPVAAKSGEVVHSGRRNPAPEPDFSNTEPYDPGSHLGSTQYGGLN